MNSWITPIKKTPLSRVVMNSIKEGILSGSLKPGEFLPSESEIASSFGVGKSSVREAMKMLEAIGYIEVSKGNGYKVRTTADPGILNPFVFQLVLENNESRDDLLAFRKVIEISASMLAMEKATDEDFEKMKANIDITEEHMEEGISTFEDDCAFHEIVYASTHNPYLRIIGDAITELFRPSLKKSNENHSDLVLEDHKAIYKALRERDKDAVAAAINNSLSRWYILSLS